MKYREALLEQLKNQSYFTKKVIYQLSERYGLKNTTIDSYISRSLKRKEIVSLRKGLYVSADFYNKNKGNISYKFYLANVLRKPSYVTSWTALQYYNLTTEIIHTITSATPKVTRNYKTKIGTFSYQSLKEELFTGFVSVNDKPAPYGAEGSRSGFNFFIASPSKALFDLLYFRTRQFKGIKFEDITKLVEELRIDLDEMEEDEKEKFYTMVKKYMKYESR